MTKLAAFAFAAAIAFAPAAYAADDKKADDHKTEAAAPKTKEECEKVKGMKWDEAHKKCVKADH
jgi:ribosomal protein L12E/L44/L45/RPP1/RPP2